MAHHGGRSSGVCVSLRQGKILPLPPLRRATPVPGRPWSRITLDFVTGLPPSHGNTIVDRFSKSVHFVALSKLPTAHETGSPRQHVLCLHGIPLDMASDRGPQFISKVWSVLPVSPQASTCSSMGRLRADLESALRCVVTQNTHTWSSHLAWIEYAHNSIISAATGLSPFEAPFPSPGEGSHSALCPTPPP